MRRRATWITILVVTVVFVVWWLIAPHRLAMQSFNEIQPGMTIVEVSELFGTPPVNFNLGCEGVTFPLEFSAPVSRICIWTAGQNRFVIGFGAGDKVTAKLHRRVDFATSVRVWLTTLRAKH